MKFPVWGIVRKGVAPFRRSLPMCTWVQEAKRLGVLHHGGNIRNEVATHLKLHATTKTVEVRLQLVSGHFAHCLPY